MIADLRRAVVAGGGARQFTETVFQPLAEAYLLTRCMFEDGDVPAKVAEGLYRLALLEQLCDDEWVGCALLGLSALDRDSDALVEFLHKLDRFAHVQLAIRPQRAERRKRYRRASESMKADLSGFDPSEVFAITPSDQQRFLARIGLRLNDTTARTAKAVLMRLDSARGARSARWYLDRLSSEQTAYSVEHVLPAGRTLAKKSEWRDAFADDQIRWNYADCLGNLLLVTEEANQRAGQRVWSTKQQTFADDPETSAFALVSEVLDAETWSADHIKTRQEALVRESMRIWDIAGKVPDPSDPNLKSAGRARLGRKR